MVEFRQANDEIPELALFVSFALFIIDDVLFGKSSYLVLIPWEVACSVRSRELPARAISVKEGIRI